MAITYIRVSTATEAAVRGAWAAAGSLSLTAANRALLKDWKLSIAIGGGCLALIIGAIVVGKLLAAMGTIVAWIAIIGGSGIGLALVYTVAEMIWRKEIGISWWTAFKVAVSTSPWEDYQDAVAKARAKVEVKP
jgi:hypothetical protein